MHTVCRVVGFRVCVTCPEQAKKAVKISADDMKVC